MKDKRDISVTLAEYYAIDTKEYINAQIIGAPFSVRVINCLMRNNITTISDMLNLSIKSISKFKGFGATCLDEVEKFCVEIQSGKDNTTKELKTALYSNTTLCSNIFKENSDAISVGDYSFTEGIALSNPEIKELQNYKDIHSILGDDLVFDCIHYPQKVIPIIEMLDTFQNKARRYSEINKLLEYIPLERQHKKAIGFINAFTLYDEERILLHNLCPNEETTIISAVKNSNLTDDGIYLLLKRFVKWCSFDLAKDIDQLFQKLYKNDRMQLVIKMRAQRKTLEEVGTAIGVTRERVRQIESKAKHRFNKLHGTGQIISKIAAEYNGDIVITQSKIEAFCKKNSEELLYLLQSYESINYVYDNQLNVFILGDESLRDKVQLYLETLPDIVPIKQLAVILETANENENIPKDMLEKAFVKAYKITGEVYHRCRLSLAKIYSDIIEKYYQNGIRVYDPAELSSFRNHVFSDYGDVGLPANNRALSSRISNICVLCGRGIYCLKRERYLSDELSQKIYKYINESDNPVFLTNTLFNVFESELLSEGIDNKYYLQGVLHELFGNEFVFRRDYISKDANITSVYPAIVDYIKKFPYPVSKKQIQQAFPGITEIVILFATSDEDIINLFGEYVHGSQLNISDTDKVYFTSLIRGFIAENHIIHYKKLFDYIHNDDPDLLNKLFVYKPNHLFSVLEYLFRDQYQFKRPFIAMPGTEINAPSEQLKEYILSNDEIAISDITAFARENHYTINSILDEVNSFNDTHLLINRDKLLSIESIGITKDIANEVIYILTGEVAESLLITDLKTIYKFPKVNVPWTEWLVYSVMMKWSSELEVGTTSNQFKLAVPVIAPKGKLHLDQFVDASIDSNASTAKIDDLDNIDNLISDYIDLEIDEDLL